jgi:hypothetical protein
MAALRPTERCRSSADRSRRRTFGTLLAAAVTASALAGCHSSGAPTSQTDSRNYSVHGHVRTLVVTAHVGDVRVTAGNGVEISVTQHDVFRGPAPTIRHRLTAGTLSLTSHCAVHEVCSVSYDITVPRATATRISDDLGTVRLSTLAGQVNVTVNAGQIDLSSLSGPVEATTRAGSIIGQHLASAHTSLRVSTGEIDVSFSAAPASVSAITDLGAVILRVPANVSYDVATSATVGHIAVKVTQNTAAPRIITATTKIGSITIEPSPG